MSVKIKYDFNLRYDNSDDYEYKHMKIKINDDYDLLLEKTLKACKVVALMRSIINGGNKYYTQILLDECLYLICVKIAMQT